MLKTPRLAPLVALSISTIVCFVSSLFLLACTALQAAPTADPTSAAPVAAAPASGVSLKVAYADTLQGVSALYAVRACAYDERSGTYPRLIELKSAVPSDVELQLMDERGFEVSHYSGARAVCDYAKFAAAFAARSHQSTEISHE